MQGLFDAKIGTNNSRLFFHLCQALEEKSQQCALDIRHYTGMLHAFKQEAKWSNELDRNAYLQVVRPVR